VRLGHKKRAWALRCSNARSAEGSICCISPYTPDRLSWFVVLSSPTQGTWQPCWLLLATIGLRWHPSRETQGVCVNRATAASSYQYRICQQLLDTPRTVEGVAVLLLAARAFRCFSFAVHQLVRDLSLYGWPNHCNLHQALLLDLGTIEVDDCCCLLDA